MKVEIKLIKTKLGLLNLAEKLGNVSEACRINLPYANANPGTPFFACEKTVVYCLLEELVVMI